MKIAMLGYGKMGKTIEQLALSKDYQVPLKITADNTSELTVKALQQCDVAIEFSTPETAYSNLKLCIKAGIPVVCGTTGWLDHLDKLIQSIYKKDGTFLYASNFSLGVNLFFEINKQVASLLGKYQDYIPVMHEIHHTEKKDAPSGTAITLASQINDIHPTIKGWTEDMQSNDSAKLKIASHRQPDVPGTHIINYTSPIDDITISHVAKNRVGFALGALLSAEFIHDKKGVFTMADVLGIHSKT